MPLYAYACPNCGERFDALKSLRERKDPEPCPSCGEVAERAMSGYSVGGKVSAGGGGSPSYDAAPSSCGFSGG
jgi:putative FmdB family regulatory protein